MAIQQLLKQILLEWSKPESCSGHTPVFWKHRREMHSWRDMLTLPDFLLGNYFSRCHWKVAPSMTLRLHVKGYVRSLALCLLCILHFFFGVLEAKRLETGTRVLRLLLVHLCVFLTCVCIADREMEWGLGGMWANSSLTHSQRAHRVLPCYSIQMALNITDTPHSGSRFKFFLLSIFSFQMEWGGGRGRREGELKEKERDLWLFKHSKPPE